jgi:hypothetical protein
LREFLTEVILTPAGKVNEQSRLCQSYKVIPEVREIRMPDKLRAVEHLVGKALTSFHLVLASPSTGKAIPVPILPLGEVRNSTQWATSWEVPKRGHGASCKASLPLFELWACCPSHHYWESNLSFLSGKPYLVKFADGHTRPTGEWLRAEVQENKR